MKLPDLKSPVENDELAPAPEPRSSLARFLGGMFGSDDKREIERMKAHLAWTEGQRTGLKGSARNGA